MSSGLIFLTGATGFIGSAIALQALKSGYSLRISVRNESQIPKLQSLLSGYADQIDFVLTPDITLESSFAGKLDGVQYVLHVASPLPHGVDKQTYFRPAVQGTTAILKEASKVPSIKKVVVTSSIAAFIPIGGVPAGGIIKEDNDWDFSLDPEADFTGPNDTATGMKLYHASKLLADHAARDFKRSANPRFALVTLHPAYVYGHNHLQTSAEELGGTNGLFFGTVRSGVPMSPITAVHVEDVAEAHIKALNESVQDGERFLLAGKKATWKDVAAIVKREYPDRGFKISEDIAGESSPVDTSKVERALGIQWRTLEAMTREIVDQQLAFL
ncbi:hypothetical protein BJX99DRAFT_224203 [Aspergillus californicus]